MKRDTPIRNPIALFLLALTRLACALTGNPCFLRGRATANAMAGFRHAIPIFTLYALLSVSTGSNAYGNPPDNPAVAGGVPPTNFISHIATTDRIVATYLFIPERHKPRATVFTITGPTLTNVLHALSLLRSLPGNHGMSGTMHEWQLQFYNKTNCLETACFQGDCVLCPGEYVDNTGIMNSLYLDLSNKMMGSSK